MTTDVHAQTLRGVDPKRGDRRGDPCVMVIFGASGDLTKRLLMPAIYNLACDRLLPDRFAIVGTAMDQMTSEQFRERMTTDIRKFTTRQTFDEKVWADFVPRLHYTPGDFGNADFYRRLLDLVNKVGQDAQTGGNVLFYFAVPPKIFGMISTHLAAAGGIKADNAWRRVIVEKPFGHDLPSAISLNKELLAHWREEQIYRIDHYLGKETVQNLLAFRFANGIFEPLWNKTHVDHIQFNVCETVGVEGRGGYYDTSGVLRDMIQNHMFQMLAYLCMEPPSSFKSDAVRNEKAKLLESVRIFTPEEVKANTVRGQYGPGIKADGKPTVGYRQEPDVKPESATETFAALKLFIDNWRWDGVPIYLRSGKALWKRGTEIVVQFRKAPAVLFRGTPSEDRLGANKLLFHIQPDQGIEFRLHAKTPGPALYLQNVNMRFDYRESFEAARGTGYEVLVYQCMIGDATLFSRTDLVETAWRIAQPMLDLWGSTKPTDFPNYPAGTWGPKAAYDLIERDGRRWIEVINREVLGKVPLFQGADAIFLHNLSMALKTDVYEAGDEIVRQGDTGKEMYIVARGQVEVLEKDGKVKATLGEGSFFGEIALLTAGPRTATVRAKSACDLYILEKTDFDRVVQDQPHVAEVLRETAKSRYNVTVPE